MRDRVDEPRRMKSRDGAKKNAPQYKGQSTDSEQRESEDNRGHKMILGDPDVKVVLGQIGDIALEC